MTGWRASLGGKGLDVVIPFVTVTLIWGSTWLVIRDQVGTVPATWSVTYRFAVASVAMFMLAAWQRDPLVIGRRAMGFAVLLGFTQFVLNFNFVYQAERYLTSGVVAILYALLLIPNSLLAWAIFREPVSRAFVAGSAVSVAGVALLFVNEYRASNVDPSNVLLGIAFGAGGLFAASVSNVAQIADVARRSPMMSLLAWAMLYGAIMDAALALFVDGAPSFDSSPRFIGGVLWLALAGSVVTFPLYFRLIQKIGAGRAAYSSVLIPAIAMLLSTFFEAYVWTPLAIAGAVLSVIGMVIALRGRAQPRSEARPSR